MQRLKSSIAISKSHGISPYGSSTSTNLVQFVADNFDAQISSQNGLSSTHSLGIIAAVTNLSPETIKETKTTTFLNV